MSPTSAQSTGWSPKVGASSIICPASPRSPAAALGANDGRRGTAWASGGGVGDILVADRPRLPRAAVCALRARFLGPALLEDDTSRPEWGACTRPHHVPRQDARPGSPNAAVAPGPPRIVPSSENSFGLLARPAAPQSAARSRFARHNFRTHLPSKCWWVPPLQSGFVAQGWSRGIT